MGHPGAFGRGPPLHQGKEPECRGRDKQRLQRNGNQHMHHLSPLAFRARAIMASSSSSSLVSSLSDMPSKAEAALAGDPLKKTRTISLSADFLATFSERTGL